MDAHTADPAAMRQQAANLRDAAERLTTLVERVDRRVEATEYRGPAADRFRAAMTDRSLRGRRAAQQLNDLADTVLQGAARAEQSMAGGGPA
jgi:uncharacterized protein YukE